MNRSLRPLAALLLALAALASPADAREAIIGEIRMFAGTVLPANWFYCDGQLLPISSYIQLFSVIGTLYGGDGINNFALPDLRGRSPMHEGQGPGLTNRTLGTKSGVE